MKQAKLIFYAAFIDGKLEAPRSLLPEVHRLYFEPQYEEFSPRTMWSLSNAFTSASRLRANCIWSYKLQIWIDDSCQIARALNDKGRYRQHRAYPPDILKKLLKLRIGCAMGIRKDLLVTEKIAESSDLRATL